MFTNSAYEMSMGFSNIRGLTMSTRIFINYIRRHHKWNLIFKGKERANNIFIHIDTSKVYLGKIQFNLINLLFLWIRLDSSNTAVRLFIQQSVNISK